MSPRAELQLVLGRLSDTDVEALLADARARLRPKPARTLQPFAWAGAIKDGPPDASTPEKIDEVLAGGFGRKRRPSDWLA